MHPILADWRILTSYLFAWTLVGGLLAALLVTAAPFGWLEVTVFTLPLAILYGFVGLGSFWVCRAAPLNLSRLLRSLGTQLVAAILSAVVWLVAGRGWALFLDRYASFPGLAAKQTEAAPFLFGLGLMLYFLAAALHYLLGAYEDQQEAQRRALELEIASREAELRALRAQIHPHFLFNSLNSINALIASRPEEARRLCVRLGDFLRRSLTLGSRERIPLSEELELIEGLLAIEKARFGERLNLEVQAGEDVRRCTLPPLILQPLVENAVTHGIAQMLDGGTIRIEARRHGAQVRVTVENPKDPDAADRRGAGIGTRNVRRRLAAIYGNDASMDVASEAESFRVEVRFPCSD
jgi:hypothetical protein